MSDSITKRIQSILDANRSTEVSVRFTKKSGEIRTLKFRPDDYLPTLGTGRKSPEDMFTVVDAEIRQWRSFKSQQVISISIGKKLHSFCCS